MRCHSVRRCTCWLVWNYDPIFRGLKLHGEELSGLGWETRVWNYDPIFRGLKRSHDRRLGRYLSGLGLEL